MSDLSRYYDRRLPKSRLREVTLRHGNHSSREGGVCAMEAVAWLVNGMHTDKPACVCPVIGAFMRSWNDALPNDDDRNRLLRPLLPRLIGTAGDAALMTRRAWMATDWLVRVHTVAWLDLAGLGEHAKALRGLPELKCGDDARAAQGLIDAARAAARAAAGAAAGDAARAAAGDAAGDAAWAALDPTTRKLQRGAQQLVRRMCEVT